MPDGKGLGPPDCIPCGEAAAAFREWDHPTVDWESLYNDTAARLVEAVAEHGELRAALRNPSPDVIYAGASVLRFEGDAIAAALCFRAMVEATYGA